MSSPAAEEAEKALDRLRAELDRCPYHSMLGPEAISADPATRSVRIRLAYRPEFRLAADQQQFHGGVLASLVDITAHAAVAVVAGQVSPTVDLRLDFLAPARGSTLVATGTLVKLGSTIARADVAVQDPDDRVVVLGRGTFIVQRGFSGRALS